jgi:hypothetical protein
MQEKGQFFPQFSSLWLHLHTAPAHHNGAIISSFSHGHNSQFRHLCPIWNNQHTAQLSGLLTYTVWRKKATYISDFKKFWIHFTRPNQPQCPIKHDGVQNACHSGITQLKSHQILCRMTAQSSVKDTEGPRFWHFALPNEDIQLTYRLGYHTGSST